MKQTIDPEQRMRFMKRLLIAIVVLCFLVYGLAYTYQYIWPKKPILVDSIENQPPASTNP